jgi:hypothetical protein
VDLIILAGGRGSGKSTASIMAIVSHAAALGEHAAPLAIRESYNGLAEYMAKVYAYAVAVFGPRVTYNKADSVISLPTGGHIYGASLHEGEAAYVRWQGRNLTGIFSEETGLLSPTQFALMRRLEANLRPPPQFKAERVWSLNPNGPLHQIMMRNWISKTPPWKANRDHTGLSYVWTRSTYRDNPHLPSNYAETLMSSVGADASLRDAWMDGVFSPLAGSRFQPDPAVHLIPSVPTHLLRHARFTTGSDYGNSAPSTAVLVAELATGVSLGPIWLPRGSLVALEETSTVVDDNDTTIGSGLDPKSFGSQIKGMLAKYDAADCSVITDDAKGLLSDSVIDYFKEAGLDAIKPEKGAGSRVEGWDVIGQHLANAVTGRGVGLYITEKCPHLWRTLGEAPRGQLNPRDLCPRYDDDHFLDAARYSIRAASTIQSLPTNVRTTGWF